MQRLCCALLTYSERSTSRGELNGAVPPAPITHLFAILCASLSAGPTFRSFTTCLYEWAGMSGDTIRTLPNGYEYVLMHFYTPGEAKANIVRTSVMKSLLASG